MKDYSTYKTIQVELKEHILTLTLNRPDSLNAVDAVMHEELARIFADAQVDEEARAVILTGAGKAFCAGGDIKKMEEIGGLKSFPRTMWEAKKLINDILDLEKPIICAVNGPAIGLGATIALFCDIVIASERAFFADTHVKVGIVAGDGGAVIWPLLMGPNRAKQYLMTGDSLKAHEAERLGLVNFVVPEDKLAETAWHWATRLAKGPTRAISGSKVAVNKSVKAAVNLILDTSLALEGHTFTTDDHQEAKRAFIEKRPPQFKGM